MVKKKHTDYMLYSVCLLLTVLLPAIPFVKEAVIGYDLLITIYWSIVGVVIIYILPGIRSPGMLSGRKGMVILAVSGAFIYIAIHFIIGIIMKQLKLSPYDTSVYGIVLNILLFFPALIVREMIRAYCMGSIYRIYRNRIVLYRLLLVLLTLVMALTEINYPKTGQLTGDKEIFIYLVKNVLIVVARNVLLSCFVFYGSAKAGIVYWGIIQLFWHSFPVLPDLPWFPLATIGIAFPILYAMVLSERYAEYSGEIIREKEKISPSYIMMLICSVALVWFSVGVFSVYPSVILTGSMEPKIYPGDIVLINKLKTEEDIRALREGDIINFNKDDFNVTHRIIAIEYDEAGNFFFITKGDNNKSEDIDPVMPEQINGVVKQTISKIGLPVLLIKGKAEVPKGVEDVGEIYEVISD